ncbi:MAG: hypothetical protein AAF581_11040 [Planctomycetota bacterium]
MDERIDPDLLKLTCAALVGFSTKGFDGGMQCAKHVGWDAVEAARSALAELRKKEAPSAE